MGTDRLKPFLSVIAVSSTVAAGLSGESLRTVATTEWVAAFCRAAGLTEVHVLAPATLTHPPDYELKPSDIPVLTEAELIVFGGYESMMGRIRSQIAGTETRMLRIDTTYEPSKLEASVRAIAEVAGTSADGEKGIAGVREAWSAARRIVAGRGLTGKRAVVHRFQAPFAAAVGLDVIMVFGPAPPGPGSSPMPQPAGRRSWWITSTTRWRGPSPKFFRTRIRWNC